MTMTSEERREVAERLRGPFDVCGCGRYTYLSGTLYGMQVCTKDELTLRDGMRRLADLLDPTCEVEGSKPLYMDDETEFQLSCGHAVWMTTNEPPAYCTECGARVIS